MKVKLVRFIAGSCTLGLLAAIPAWFFGGEVGAAYVGTALVLCLIPMTATMIWCSWASDGSPESQLGAVMGGTALRMVFVVGVGVALFLTVPYFNEPTFLFWVIFIYLATLALEVVLLVGKPSKSA